MKSFIDMAISFIRMMFSSLVLIKGKSCLLPKTQETAHNCEKMGNNLLISAFVQDVEQATKNLQAKLFRNSLKEFEGTFLAKDVC